MLPTHNLQGLEFCIKKNRREANILHIWKVTHTQTHTALPTPNNSLQKETMHMVYFSPFWLSTDPHGSSVTKKRDDDIWLWVAGHSPKTCNLFQSFLTFYRSTWQFKNKRRGEMMTDDRLLSLRSPGGCHDSSYTCKQKTSNLLHDSQESSSSGNWTLMSCQPHRVTSGQSNSGHKQIHISKLFSYTYQPSVKSVYKTNHFTNRYKFSKSVPSILPLLKEHIRLGRAGIVDHSV